MFESVILALSVSFLYILSFSASLTLAHQPTHIYEPSLKPISNERPFEDKQEQQARPKSNGPDTRRIGSNSDNQHLANLHAKLQKVKDLASGQLTSYDLSPSTISSIYNFINGKGEKPQTSTTKAPTLISSLSEQQLLSQPIALGSSPGAYQNPQNNEANYLQLGPAFSPESISTLSPSSTLKDNSKLFNGAVLSGDDQLFNEMYVNDLQSNQLLGPSQTLIPRPLSYVRQASHIHEAQQNFYNSPNYYPVAHNSIKPPRTRHPIQQMRPKMRPLPSSSKHIRPIKHGPPVLPSPQYKKRNMLSNEQLVSLIDELKEFNSRQASKIQSSNMIHPDRDVKMPTPAVIQLNRPLQKAVAGSVSESAQEKDQPLFISTKPKRREKELSQDNDEVKSPALRNSVDHDTTGPLEEDQSKDEVEDEPKESKMSADDLTKFAQFLMTKKGADLKFQLGLDKDAKDDGDEEDDQDVLLESKEKQMKARPKDKLLTRLEEFQKQHDVATSKVAKMVDNVGFNGKHKSNRDDMDDDKSRSRRDHSVYSGKHTEKEVREEEKTLRPVDEKKAPTGQSVKLKPPIKVDDEENLAKMLIKQEIMEDQRESSQDPPSSTKIIKFDKKNNRPDETISNLAVDAFAETNLPISRAEEGEKNHEYPKKERSDDRETLRHELQKTRKKKSDTRTRIPMAMDDIIKRALDGEMGLSTERLPDGQIVFKDAKKGTLVTMKVPSKSLNKESVAVEEPEKDSNYPQSRHTPSEESSPNQNETEVLDSVQISSQKPLQDEYPISEKVSDRLNKLSNNLDRYFNDGFLREVEAKSGLNEGDVDSHLPESSNVNTAETVQRPPKKEIKKVDEDFDVDITIDGKKDRDDDEDEYKDNERPKEGRDRTASATSRRKKKTPGRPGNEVNVRYTKVNKPFKDAGASSPLKRGKIVKNENIKIERHLGTLPNLDPVDSESLETPIGPDGEETDSPDTTSKTRIKSTRGSNVSSNYGKSKFYEEPDWNAR